MSIFESRWYVPLWLISMGELYNLITINHSDLRGLVILSFLIANTVGIYQFARGIYKDYKIVKKEAEE